MSLIPSLEEIYLFYYQSLSNVEEPLQLSVKQEEILLQFLFPKSAKNNPSLQNRFRQVKGYSYKVDELQAESHDREFLGICNGYFPRCITHIQPELTFREKFKALRKDPDFVSRYHALYQYPPNHHRWKEMIYTLATQKTHSLTDQFLLFFAHVYEIKGSKAVVPTLQADDNEIREWYQSLILFFRISRIHGNCFDRCNPYAALEFKPPPTAFISTFSQEISVARTPGLFLWPIAHSQKPLSDLQSPIAVRYLEPAVQVLEEHVKVNLPPQSKDPVYGKCMESHRSFYLRDRAFAAE